MAEIIQLHLQDMEQAVAEAVVPLDQMDLPHLEEMEVQEAPGWMVIIMQEVAEEVFIPQELLAQGA